MKFVCAECGSELEIDEGTCEDGDQLVCVKPCEECKTESNRNGYLDGHGDGVTEGGQR